MLTSIYLHSQIGMYAFQLNRIYAVPASSFFVLLVCVRSLYCQVEVAVAFPERLCGSVKLCVLRLVGLAFSTADYHYLVKFVGKRDGDEEYRGESEWLQ